MNKNRGAFAYAFYATDNRYAVAALVAICHLKKLQAPNGVDFVLLHLNVSDDLLAKFGLFDVVLIPCQPLPYISHDYYRHCLIKLNVLSLTQYERVLFLDADALPMQNMGELFELDYDADIAAPPCWWLGDGATSILLLVKPSMALWERVSKYFPSADRDRLYDMDIINQEFVFRNDHLHFLDPRYGCLNSVWERQEEGGLFGDQDRCIGEMKFIHFSALGKPWDYSVDRSRKEKPDAHPFFHELFRLWWARLGEMSKLIPSTPPPADR